MNRLRCSAAGRKQIQMCWRESSITVSSEGENTMPERADAPLKGQRVLVVGDPSGVGHYIASAIQGHKCRVLLTRQLPAAPDNNCSSAREMLLGCELLRMP